jgi:hypothetical protein
VPESGRNKAGSEVRQRREDEEPFPEGWVRNLEEAGGGARVDRRGTGSRGRRALDGDAVATEDQQV